MKPWPAYRARRSRRADARHSVLHHPRGRFDADPAASRAPGGGPRRAGARAGRRSEHRRRGPPLHAFERTSPMSKCGSSIRFPADDSRPGPACVASAIDIRRINHRMHNKLFVADNALAITGGRNIGDQYFTRDPYNNFIDLDVVAAGAIVPELSASFDEFWNSKYAYPIASVASPVDADAAPPAPPDDGADAERELAGAGARCARVAADLGAGHRARGSAREDRQRNLARTRRSRSPTTSAALMRFGETGTRSSFRRTSCPARTASR